MNRKRPTRRNPADQDSRKRQQTQAIGPEARSAWLLPLLALATSLVLLWVWLSPFQADDSADSDVEVEPAAATSPSMAAKELSAGAAAPTIAEPPTPLVLPIVARDFEVEPEQQRLLEQVDKAAEAYPGSASVQFAAALVYAELLNTELAIEFFERALKLPDYTAEMCVEYADTLAAVAKSQPAIEMLKQAIAEDRVSLAVLSRLGDAYLQVGQAEQAVSVLERAATLYPHDLTHLPKLAAAHLQNGEFAKAASLAKRAIELGNAEPATYLTLSTALLRSGDRDEATRVRQEMPTMVTQNAATDEDYQNSFREFAAQTYATLGNQYALENNAERAEALYLQSIELSPRSLRSLRPFADMLRRQGRFQDALFVQQRLLEAEPDNVTNYLNVASLAASLGNVALAEEALVRSTRIDASGPAKMRLAQFYFGVGKLDQAATYAQAAAEQLQSSAAEQKLSVDVYLFLSNVLSAQGKAAAAYNAILKAKEIAPDDPRLSTQ